MITPRWYPLRAVPAYDSLTNSGARFDVIEAGRRSGKTELVKRMAVEEAWCMGRAYGRWYTKLCAPTLRQSVDIFWQDIQDLTKPLWSRRPNISDKVVYLRGGAEIWICGLDRPQRIEGSPINRLAVDELADVKPDAWERNLRPALDTEQPGYPPARAWLFGVPRPGSQFSKLSELAQDPTEPDYAYHTWTSEGVLSPEKIEAARRTMDERVYAQEYLAQRVSMEGMAYYQWSRGVHCRSLEYNPGRPLIFCFDFNVSPGVAAVLQEQDHRHDGCGNDPLQTTCVTGQVHIPNNSNTVLVCRRLMKDWGHHQGDVLIYGDPSGGARHTSSEKSDWENVRQTLGEQFAGRLRWRVPRSAPYIRDRVNSVNARMRSVSGDVRFLVDPHKAPDVAKDFENIHLLKGGSGEVDKKRAEDNGFSHLSEAIGYYIHEKHPLGGTKVKVW